MGLPPGVEVIIDVLHEQDYPITNNADPDIPAHEQAKQHQGRFNDQANDQKVTSPHKVFPPSFG